MTSPTAIDLNGAAPEEEPRRSRLIGRSGLKHWAGYIQQEFLPELRGERAYRIYDEMRKNEPTIAGFLTAIEMIIATVTFDVEPGVQGSPIEADGADKAAALHIKKNLFHRLARPFEDMVIEVLTMLPFGWALFEESLKYEEGKIWWDDFEFRSQQSLFRWDIDVESGRIVAFEQRPAPTYELISIPAERFLLFRTKAEMNDPEGYSILRSSYKPYFYKRVLEEVEAMGAERDLLGIPILDVPYGATEEEEAEAQRIVENIKNDDQSGFVSTAIGPEPEQRFVLHLLTGQGQAGRTAYTDKLVQRYNGEMAMGALAQFLQLGMSGRGTGYNLSSEQRDLFQVAVKGWLQRILGVFNTIAIPRLLRRNGMTGKCYMTHGRITQINLQSIANFLAAGVQNKFITPTPTLERFLRQEAELPEISDEEIEAAKAPATPPPMEGPGTSGVNANPGENQRGLFAPKQAGAEVQAPKPQAPPVAASEEDDDLITLADLDDTEIWEEYSRKVLGAFSGEFWE